MSWWTYKKEADGKVYMTSHDISGLPLVGMDGARFAFDYFCTRSQPARYASIFFLCRFRVFACRQDFPVPERRLVFLGSATNDAALVARVQNRIYSHRCRRCHDDRGLSRKPLSAQLVDPITFAQGTNNQ